MVGNPCSVVWDLLYLIFVLNLGDQLCKLSWHFPQGNKWNNCGVYIHSKCILSYFMSHCSCVIHALYIGRMRSMHKGTRATKHYGKGLLRKPRYRWCKNNMKMDLREVCSADVKVIYCVSGFGPTAGCCDESVKLSRSIYGLSWPLQLSTEDFVPSN